MPRNQLKPRALAANSSLPRIAAVLSFDFSVLLPLLSDTHPVVLTEETARSECLGAGRPPVEPWRACADAPHRSHLRRQITLRRDAKIALGGRGAGADPDIYSYHCAGHLVTSTVQMLLYYGLPKKSRECGVTP